MIRVCYDPRSLQLWVHGHSDLAPRGTDPVCAAASVLVYTLCAAVTDRVAEGSLRGAQWELHSGRAHIGCDPRQPAAGALRAQFETVCRGFELLHTQFPQQLQYHKMQKGDRYGANRTDSPPDRG